MSEQAVLPREKDRTCARIATNINLRAGLARTVLHYLPPRPAAPASYPLSHSAAIVAVLFAVSQLEAALVVSISGCVASWTHPFSIHVISSFCAPRSICCVAFAATAVSPRDHWLEEVVRPVALPFGGEWACASTLLPDVTQRKVACCTLDCEYRFCLL